MEFECSASLFIGRLKQDNIIHPSSSLAWLRYMANPSERVLELFDAVYDVILSPCGFRTINYWQFLISCQSGAYGLVGLILD